MTPADLIPGGIPHWLPTQTPHRHDSVEEARACEAELADQRRRGLEYAYAA